MSEVISVATSRDDDEDDLFGSGGNATASSSRLEAGRTPSRKRNADSAQLPESESTIRDMNIYYRLSDTSCILRLACSSPT